MLQSKQSHTVQYIQKQIQMLRPLTCSLIFCRLSVVVLHSHRWNHHCPDTTGTPAVHCRGRQWCYHGSQRWVVVAVTVVKVMVGAVALWGS